jgi:DNA-binding PadR family transcriptional regulator
MSPVFRHGSLRLYLLKLLDESPRHGYEIIRLLQDRFLGVYAPSPGTIYPRLARLEEEGLVTHDEIDGKKVYRITDRGREELHAREDDLAELEEEITASVRDIAREVTEDVRETVRSLREEIASAARDMNRPRGRAGADPRQARDEARSARDAGQAKSGKGGGRRARDAWGEAGDVWGQAAQAGDEPEDEPGQQRGGRGRGGWPGWAGGPGWGDWTGAGGPRGHSGHRPYRDLERLARQFARDLRMAAWHAQAVSEDALGDLRVILDETLDRIKAEVFATTPGPSGPADAAAGPGPDAGSGPDTGSGPGAHPGSGAAPTPGPTPDDPEAGSGAAPGGGGTDSG